jgi:hypothetical protein
MNSFCNTEADLLSLNTMNAGSSSMTKSVPGVSAQSVVKIQDLVVEYRARGLGHSPTVAVNKLTLEVHQGEVFGFPIPDRGRTAPILRAHFPDPSSGGGQAD